MQSRDKKGGDRNETTNRGPDNGTTKTRCPTSQQLITQASIDPLRPAAIPPPTLRCVTQCEQQHKVQTVEKYNFNII